MKNAEPTRYLIVGNGAAAVQAVEAIRKLDAAGAIVLVARESEHTYSRPLITYHLAGKADDAGMDYRKKDFYTAHAVRTKLGVDVTKLDLDARTATCSDGATIVFEKLLLATGGTPIRPEIPGSQCTGVFTFTTWAEERAVDAYLRSRPNMQAVVLGGGLIGLKTVEALVARKVSTTIVELADRILPMTFDQQASNLAQQSLAKAGVAIRTQATVAQVHSDAGQINAVTLSTGEKLPCDLLILAIGVRPEMGLAKCTAVKTDRGIVVDERMATSVADVYAAGDCCQALDALTGTTRPIPILPTAARQGRIAGTNMAGGSARYEGGVPMNAVDVVGLPTISIGSTVEQPGDKVLSRLDAARGVYRKLVIRGNRLIGAIFIGKIERAGLYSGLIRTGLDVSAFENLLLDDQFGLLSLPGDYRAHMVSGAGIEV